MSTCQIKEPFPLLVANPSLMSEEYRQMEPNVPPNWREDLQTAVPWVAATKAEWLRNLNAATPWRTVVGEIRLDDGQRVILKYQTDAEGMQKEHAAARFLEGTGAPRIAAACLGADTTRRVLVFERLDGPTLVEALEGEGARAAWLEAARALASLHHWAAERTARWLELCPRDRIGDRRPVYARPFEALVAPFRRVGAAGASLMTAITLAQQAVAAPGPWLGFTHSDLQTRHVFCTASGMRVVDWERAGPRHQLYDLACLITKPVRRGRRVPRWAETAAVAKYARACALDAKEVSQELAPVLAYEYLVGVAEEQTEDSSREQARAALDGLRELAERDVRFAPIGEVVPALRELLPGEDLPFCAGLGWEEAGTADSP
jgi:Phosphotransferase enzyme family